MMFGPVDAAQVKEVREMLTSLGYRNPSAEDIALTLQQVSHASRREYGSPSSKQENALQQPSASPPRRANDVTMTPYNEDNDDDSNRYVEDSDEEVQKQSGWKSHHHNSASLKRQHGLSSHSIRDGRTTPVNSRGTGRHSRWCRVADSQTTREYRHQQPYHGGEGSVVVEGRPQQVGGRRQIRRNVDPGCLLHTGYESATAAKDGIVISTTANPIGGAGDREHYFTAAGHMNPQARLERHLKCYERGLKAFYANVGNNDAQDEFLGEGDLGDEDDEESFEEESLDLGERGYGGNPAVCYGGFSHHLVVPEMPLRPNRAVLHQRGANTIYSFTGDSRYKYRGGSGTPLSFVLGPDGSTLRQRSDPVRRGQQMREMWKNDKFLAQHGRKEDRWKVRQNMLSWNP